MINAPFNMTDSRAMLKLDESRSPRLIGPGAMVGWSLT